MAKGKYYTVLTEMFADEFARWGADPFRNGPEGGETGEPGFPGACPLKLIPAGAAKP